MKIDGIKEGEIFCMGGNKTYPKLKLDVGCVDIRDEIVRRDEAHTINFDCELMTGKEIEIEFKKYGMTIDDVKNFKNVCVSTIGGDRKNKTMRFISQVGSFSSALLS